MTSTDLWAGGNAYERYMGRWSRAVGRQFIAWLDVPTGSSWLDIGCGTGALTETILQSAGAARVVGIDPSENFIAHANATKSNTRTEFEVGDAQSIPIHLRGFDVVVSGLVLNFIPNKIEALQQMARAARPGGTVAAYVWDYAEGMQLIRHLWDVASELDDAARSLDEGRQPSVCNPEALTALFSQGLHNVEVTSLVVPTVFRDFEDYWTPFLGGVGQHPATLSLWTSTRGYG